MASGWRSSLLACLAAARRAAVPLRTVVKAAGSSPNSALNSSVCVPSVKPRKFGSVANTMLRPSPTGSSTNAAVEPSSSSSSAKPDTKKSSASAGGYVTTACSASAGRITRSYS